MLMLVRWMMLKTTTIRINELIVAHEAIGENIIHDGATFSGNHFINDDIDEVITIEDTSAIATTDENTVQVRETFNYIPLLPLLKKLLSNSKV